ncbi:MAG: thioesterase family protein [Bdellovibrionales bacterium]|nr:thioesterase family protein [Bdellovibrionales bacterium]
MLYWHFRNWQCLLVALFKPKIAAPTLPVTKHFWANPFDSDWLHSIQAGKFFTYTDAARWELAVRSGFLGPAIKNRWVVILGGQKIIYRRPVRIFRRFSLTMQFVGWDDKWIYATHVFS